MRLNRKVALKLLLEGSQDDPIHRARFEREAAAVARCQHPHLVHIHEIGKHEENYYLALEYVDGGTLARVLAGAPQSPRFAATLVETLARAIDHAHIQGVVHRDLKPANILMTPDGQPKITDFGLAKLKDSSTQTTERTVLGTLAYMSPEQVRGESAAIGPGVDIHALGCILYETLTGRPPYRAETPEQILHAILNDEVVRPSLRKRGVPRNLEAICLKCLEKDARHRYATAADLAEDLRCFLDGRPTTARPASAVERASRWCRRKPWAAAFLAALAVGVVASILLTIRATRAERAARSAAEGATKERDRAEQARDLAFSAAQTILLTDKEQLLTEEALPYRALLLDEGLRLSREMYRGAENDAHSTKLRAEALMMEAKIHGEKGECARAYEAGSQAVELLDGLVARNPADVANRDALAHLLHQLATLATSHESERSDAQRSRDIYMALLGEYPQSPSVTAWTGAAVIDLHNIGHTYFQESVASTGASKAELLRNAIAAFHEGELLCKNLIERDGQTDELVLPLAFSERYLCRAYRRLAGRENSAAANAEDLNEAIRYGGYAIAHFQVLAGRGAAQYSRHWELQTAQRELGGLFLDSQNWPESIRLFSAARETLKSMVEHQRKSVSRSVAIQEELAMVDYDLINALTSDVVANDKLICELVEQAYKICEKVDLVHERSLNLRKTHAYVSYAKADMAIELTGLADVDLARQAEKRFSDLFTESHGDYWSSCFLIVCRLELADALAGTGQFDEADRFEKAALEVARGRPDLCFQTAYNLASSAKQSQNTRASSIRNNVRRSSIGSLGAFVPLLREAVAAGFHDEARLRHDPAFRQFQLDPEFQAVVQDLQFPSNVISPP